MNIVFCKVDCRHNKDGECRLTVVSVDKSGVCENLERKEAAKGGEE